MNRRPLRPELPAALGRYVTARLWRVWSVARAGGCEALLLYFAAVRALIPCVQTRPGCRLLLPTWSWSHSSYLPADPPGC